MDGNGLQNLGYGYKFHFSEVLKTGKFIYKGYNKNNPNIKTVNKQIKLTEETQPVEKTIDELLQKYCICHENIVPFLNHFIKSNSLWIVSEYCNKGSLLKYLKHHFTEKHISHEDATEVMIGSSKGVAFLHSRNPPFVHGRIHPENVLIHEEGGKIIVKIADCILTEIYHGFTDKNNRTASTPSGKNYSKTYKAPEYDATTKCVPKDPTYDTFVLGVVFHAVLSYNHDSLENASNLLPVLPDKSQRTENGKSLIADYVSDCNEKSQEPMLFERCVEENHNRLQNIISQMLEFDNRKRKPMRDILIELNELQIIAAMKESSEGQKHGAEHIRASKHRILKSYEDKMELKKMLKEFAKKLGRGIPPCIQHFGTSETHFRININIDKGKEKDAEAFIKKRCGTDLYEKVNFIEQSNRPEFLCGDLQGLSSKVEPGGVYFSSSTTLTHDIETGRMPLSRAIRPDDGREKLITLGCFAEEELEHGEKRCYSITVKHGLDGAIGKNIYNHLDTFSAFKNQQEVALVNVSRQNNILSIFGEHEVDGDSKLVDIAICEINRNFRQSRNKSWFIKAAPWVEGMPHRVVQGNFENNLIGHKVRKWGAKSGHTRGVIVCIDEYLNIHPVLPAIGGVFLVQSCDQGQPFCENGDSGAIVLNMQHDANTWAMGLVHQRQRNYRDPSGVVADVTLCVYLQHSLDALKKEFGIDLEIVSE